MADETKEWTPRETVKTVLGFTLGIGAGFIAKQIITNNTDEPESRKDEVKGALGMIAVSWVVRDAVQSSVDARVDMIADAWKEFRESTNKNKQSVSK